MPNPIEEQAPDVKPQGNNAIWIPGYWSWEDERKDFVWISGVWRVAPPGQRWVPGYWARNAQGFQWIAGYWTSADTTDVEYLPPPPESLENGPASDPPGQNQIWVPGCWVWREYRYMWRPGFWIRRLTSSARRS